MTPTDKSSTGDYNFSGEDRFYLRFCIDDLVNWTANNLLKPLQRALKVVIPTEVSTFMHHLNDLIARIYSTGTNFAPSENDLAILRRALVLRRQAYAAENEELQLKTSHHDVLQQLQDRLAPIESLMTSDWFRAGSPCALPLLTDFLSIKEIYSLQKDNLSAPEPEYDEKFGILLSPTQFLRRLALARIESRLRGTSISIAFIDIDNFKEFNKEYGEFIVDKSVLPIFMRSMEAHVHSHGFAFRFGGDEYMILFPNLSHVSAVESCSSYKQKLPSLNFPGVSRQLTVSIGLCTAGPDSPLTDREIQKLATDAKQVAKDAGKNRIAWIDGSTLEKRQATIQ